MDTTEARNLARSLMQQHGLTGWSFKYDRAKTRAGMCTYNTKTISMSESYVKNNEQAEVLDTILHEIAHALVGHKAGHGPVWRRKAREIGCSDARCVEAGTVITTEQHRYEGVCGGFGTPHVVGKYFRRPSARMVQHGFCKHHKSAGLTWTDLQTGAVLGGSFQPIQMPVLSEARAFIAKNVTVSTLPWNGSSDWDSMFNA